MGVAFILLGCCPKSTNSCWALYHRDNISSCSSREIIVFNKVLLSGMPSPIYSVFLLFDRFLVRFINRLQSTLNPLVCNKGLVTKRATRCIGGWVLTSVWLSKDYATDSLCSQEPPWWFPLFKRFEVMPFGLTHKGRCF